MQGPRQKMHLDTIIVVKELFSRAVIRLGGAGGQIFGRVPYIFADRSLILTKGTRLNNLLLSVARS